MIDWSAERDQFPIASRCAYLANASSTPMHKASVQAVRAYIDRMHTDPDLNDWTPYLAAMDGSRELLAALYGGQSTSWGFGVSTSHNLGLVAHALGGQGRFVSCTIEFPSSLIPFKHLGMACDAVPPKADGSICVQSLINAIQPDTVAVVISAVQFSNGARTNLAKLGELLRAVNRTRATPVRFVVNATQLLGAYPLDVVGCGIDALSCSGHKMFGAGHGVAVLYASPGFLEHARWPLGGHMSYVDPTFQGRCEHPRAGTSFVEVGVMPFAPLLALYASLQNVRRLGLAAIQARILSLSDMVVERATELGIPVGSPRSAAYECRSGIVRLQVADPDAAEQALRARGVRVNARRGGLRVSVHYYNNEADIHALFEGLRSLS